MGQYHTLYCIDARTALMPRYLGCNAKAIEHLSNPKITAAMALVCAAGFPDNAFPHPDTPRGGWAGKRIVLTGDHAKDGDLRGLPFARHGAPQTGIYTAVYDRTTTRSSAISPCPTSIGGALSPHANMLLEMEPSPKKGGQEAGLWVSLDSGEYVDTTAFGAHDLASAVAHDGWRPFLISALAQPGLRGSGDLEGDHGLGAIGRWRGDRIVFLGPKGASIEGKRLTIAQVRDTMADITGLARFVDSLHHHDADARTSADVTWTNEGGEERAFRDALKHTEDLQQSLLRAVADHWPELREPRRDDDREYAHSMPTLVVRPTTKVEVRDDKNLITHGFTVPFQASLEDSHDGRFWMPPDLRAQLRDALDGRDGAVWRLQSSTQTLYSPKTKRPWTAHTYAIGWGPTRFVRFPALTAHTQLLLKAALA